MKMESSVTKTEFIFVTPIEVHVLKADLRNQIESSPFNIAFRHRSFKSLITLAISIVCYYEPSFFLT